jgi:hypothetical protein
MNIDEARTAIIQTIGRVNTLYQGVVFDEWVLVKLASGPGMILAYQGPRAETYKARFLADITPLQTEVGRTPLQLGDFVFTHGADGTHFDACMRIGPACYLFCNHTTKPMAEIRQNPLWLNAQKPFAELGVKFQADPVV